MLNFFNRRREAPPLARLEPTLVEALQTSTLAPQAAIPLSEGYRGSELYSWLVDGAGAGVAVNERTAMCVGAVYACVGLIAGAIASMPLPLYERTPDGRKRVENHDYWWLLNEQPHPMVSAAVFWEYLVAALLLHGDGFARILRVSERSPQAIAFYPLHPLSVDVTRAEGRLKYAVYDEAGKPAVYDQDDILHIPGLGFDGRRGMSPIRYAARQAIGIALAADEYSAGFFRNGAKPDFVLKTAANLDQTQIDTLRNQWRERYGGVYNRHLPAILGGGLDVKELTMTSEDAQLIESRRFEVEDIARIYGVPPYMVGATDKSTSWGTGLEQQSIGFVRYTLQRHLTKIKQELNRKLFRTARLFFEHNTAGLERGDTKSRYEAHRISLGRAGEPGWQTINEIRRLENLPPVEGGDELNKGAGNPVADPAKEEETTSDESAAETAGE